MYGRKWEGLLVKVMRLVDLEVVVDIVDGIRDNFNMLIKIKTESQIIYAVKEIDRILGL